MAVISVTITESQEQIVAGFPKTVALDANVPATIFYTIDGSDPSFDSAIYFSPIKLPTDALEFTLKAFASSGSDLSSVITASYSTNILHNTRLPHAAVNGPIGPSITLYPYGSGSSGPMFDYLNSAKAGTTLNNGSAPQVTIGYDASGNTISANKPMEDYMNIYSTTNYKNQVTPDTGNLPGTVTVIGRRSALQYMTEESDRSSALFNARAMVVYQDARTEDPSNPPQINPNVFSMENLEISNDGAPLYATGQSSPTVSGSFIRSEYNPRTQMVTNYYRDSITNQWIISSYPYEPKGNPGNLSAMVFGRRENGIGRVYQWHQFQRRVLT